MLMLASYLLSRQIEQGEREREAARGEAGGGEAEGIERGATGGEEPAGGMEEKKYWNIEEVSK